MLAYYARLAVISIRKNWVMSLLMVAAVAIGIGAFMTILTVNYVMAKDPIPSKSDQLFAVQLDSWDPNQPVDANSEPPQQLTYIDAMALMRAERAHRQIASATVGVVVESDEEDVNPFTVAGRATFSDFFLMFEVPFQFGGPWTKEDDITRALAVVLSRETNDRLFGGLDSVGETVRISGTNFQVVGVLDDWRPMPKFYDVSTGPFNDPEGIYLPFHQIEELSLPRSGNTNCWKPIEGEGLAGLMASECIWVQFWAELPTPNDVQAYQSFIDAYAMEQKALGRFQRPLDNRLSDVNEWLDARDVVADEAVMMLPVSGMFLAVCLLNTIGLLLAKFLNKAPEIGLRRALGASRGTLFAQFLVESTVIGVVGGVLGILMTWLGLRGVDALFGDLISNLVALDTTMVVTAVALAIFATIAAGIYPTWRACNVVPAQQLKSQ